MPRQPATFTVGRFLAVLGSVAALAGCVYTGGVDNPFARKFNWYSYVAGDDIKQNCRPGSPATYRLVYNANWMEQVRAYDLRRGVFVNGGARLDTTVFTGGPLATVDLLDPNRARSDQTASVQLTEDQYLALIRAIEASGFGGPAPKGTRLKSWDFYWTAATCAGGQFHFNAWLYPSDRASQITFDRLLFAADKAPIPPNPVRRQDSAQAAERAKFNEYETFELMVDDNGLTRFVPPI